MSDLSSFLSDFTMVLCVAAVTTILFHKLRQPVVLGYLLAGLILGPHVSIPLFAHEDTVKTLAELGVILVMFSIGLKFSIRRLVRVLPSAGLTSLIEISVMMWLGYNAGHFMGWTHLESIFAGAIVAFSSTMISSKALADHVTDEKLSRMVYSVLVVQDLVAVLLVAILTPLAAGAGLSMTGLMITSGSLFGFLAVLFGVGYLVIPFVIKRVVILKSSETLLVTTIGLCFAMALLAQKGGYSVALGAFMAGMLVAESNATPIIEKMIQPLKDIFAAVFFVAVGMLVNPSVLWVHWAAVLLLTLVVLIGQTVSVTIGSFLSGRSIQASLQVGLCLAQVGEFSYIIAQVGVAQGHVGGHIYDVAVAVSVATAFTTPWLIRISGPIARVVDNSLPKPIQTLAALYGSWLEEIRHGGSEETLWSKSRRQVGFLTLDTFSLIAIVITTAASIDKWVPEFQTIFYFNTLGWRILLITVGFTLSVPFLTGILRCAKNIANLIASSALPPVAEGALDLGLAPRNALSLTLHLGILFAVGFPLMALTQPFLPFGYSPIFFAVILAILGVIFWKNAVSLHEHVQAGAQMVTQAIAQKEPEKREEVLEQVNTMIPGMGAPASIPVSGDSTAVGKTLGELNFRSAGANVIAIMRDQERFLMPSTKEIIREGDTLVLVGTHLAIRQARELLEKS